MSQGLQLPRLVKFEEYELDFVREELRKHGFVVKLQPQPFKILAYLASRPGELVTRQEIRDHVWPGDTFVDFDLAINQSIKQIRAALNDDPETPRIIATVPRRGYRFVSTAVVVAPKIFDRLDGQLVPRQDIPVLTVAHAESLARATAFGFPADRARLCGNAGSAGISTSPKCTNHHPAAFPDRVAAGLAGK